MDPDYIIHRRREGRRTLYILEGAREAPLDTEGIDQKTRARILHRAAGQCHMCGRAIAQEGIRLHVDHRIPRAWGGRTEDDNLWALCSECNEGKKAFFAGITDPRIQQAMIHESVRVRMGELLKAFAGQPVPKTYLEMVARATHDDIERRLRELRKLGWRYRFTRKREGRRQQVRYILEHWEPWPPGGPSQVIRAGERGEREDRKSDDV